MLDADSSASEHIWHSTPRAPAPPSVTTAVQEEPSSEWITARQGRGGLKVWRKGGAKRLRGQLNSEAGEMGGSNQFETTPPNTSILASGGAATKVSTQNGAEERVLAAKTPAALSTRSRVLATPVSRGKLKLAGAAKLEATSFKGSPKACGAVGKGGAWAKTTRASKSAKSLLSVQHKEEGIRRGNRKRTAPVKDAEEDSTTGRRRKLPDLPQRSSHYRGVTRYRAPPRHHEECAENRCTLCVKITYRNPGYLALHGKRKRHT